jgi:hypothetical protein
MQPVLRSAYDLGVYVVFRNVAVEGERARELPTAG